MEQAVPTNQVFKTFKKLVETAETPQDVADKEDAVIAELHGDTRWEALQEVIDGMIKSLEHVPFEATDTVESYGFRSLAANVTVAYLKTLKNLPEEIHESRKDGTK